MAKDERNAPPRQKQESRQSTAQGEPKGTSANAEKPQSQPGIGASQGQDSGRRPGAAGERPSAGTPDLKRADHDADVERGDARESLVKDPTGAFKERP